MPPLFSIIVPVFNIERFLPKCVNSILAQEYQDFELILVDDGSNDNCPQICNAYAEKDSRVIVIHKQNGGLVSARKTGAERASGDYVLCVDGDDYISNDYTKKFADCILSCGADIVCCGLVETDGESIAPFPAPRSFQFFGREGLEKDVFSKLIQSRNAAYFPPSLCGKAIKRDLYLECQNNVPDALKIGEDGACTSGCIYRAQSLAILPDSLYYYRQNTDSMTKSHKPFDWNGPRLRAECLEKQIDLSKLDFKEQWYRLIVHDLFTVSVSQFYRRGSFSTVKRDILEKLKLSIYREAIKKAEFSGSWKAALMMFALRYKCCRLMQLWAKVK